MARDNHANYARIGFTVMIGTIAIIATLIYLGGFRGADRYFMVETYYDHPVSGLSVGSPVNFRGVKIGEVREIAFTSIVYDDVDTIEDMQRVSIVMAVEKDRCSGNGDWSPERTFEKYISSGLRATVASSAITGLSRIELNIVPEAIPPARLEWHARHTLIPPSPSLMENFSEALTKILNRLKKTDFASLWSNVQSVAESSARVAERVDMMLESERLKISTTLGNVEEASASLRELSTTLKENPSLLLRERDGEQLEETK